MEKKPEQKKTGKPQEVAKPDQTPKVKEISTQIGVIVHGGGLNHKDEVELEVMAGNVVKDCGTFTEIHKKVEADKKK